MRKQKTILISIVIMLIIIVSVATVCVVRAEVKYRNLANNKLELENKLTEALKEVSSLKQEERQKSINEEILKLEGNKKNVQEQIDFLKNDINTLLNDKKSVQAEIDDLKGEVIKIKGQEKTYPAGYLTAGTDFEIGRYRIYGGNSNFVVRSSLGELKVNIILGGKYGVNEYIYEFSTGDKVQAESSFKMVLVK